MVTQRDFMHSCFNNVRGTFSYMINDRRGDQSDPSWLLNKLFEAEQLIQTSYVFGIIINGLLAL